MAVTLLACNVVIIGIAAYLIASGRLYIWGPRNRIPNIGGIAWVQAFSLTELKNSEPFVACVESKTRGWRQPVPDSSNGRPVADSVPTEYICIQLRKTGGEQIAVYQENPSSNELAFFSKLSQGENYEFPKALIKPRRATQEIDRTNRAK